MAKQQAGSPPPLPRFGDAVYIPTAGYISHGRDDFQGGRCTVSDVRKGVSGGQPADFISVRERPGHRYNWAFLGLEQAALGVRFGHAKGHPDPDYSPESNPISL
jgi:hypothetical protein